MIRNATGQPVRGENFFDREGERVKVWEDLETENVLLLAPRRVGKTSLLFRIQAEAKERACESVFCDVSGLRSELEFVERLYTAVAKSEKAGGLLGPLKRGRVREYFKRIRSFNVSGVELVFQDRLTNDWLALGEALFAGLASQTCRWLLLVDELPLLCCP